MAPALVPLMPTISKLGSANKRSSTLQVKAPRDRTLQRERDAPLLEGPTGIWCIGSLLLASSSFTFGRTL
jgi:hypothetical protein